MGGIVNGVWGGVVGIGVGGSGDERAAERGAGRPAEGLEVGG